MLSKISTLVTLLAATLVQSQSTNVTCQAQYDWMNNPKGQNPCLVAAWLVKPCVPNAISSVPTLPDNGPYQTPSGLLLNECGCNTVMYNLLSACSACQGGQVGTWQSWNDACVSQPISYAKFPKDVPDGTTIPSWSLLDPRNSNDTFVPEIAQAIATTVTGDDDQRKGVPTLTIVAFVLGGLGILGLAGAIGIYLYYRQRQRRKARGRLSATGSLDAPLNPVRVRPDRRQSLGYRYDILGEDAYSTNGTAGSEQITPLVTGSSRPGTPSYYARSETTNNHPQAVPLLASENAAAEARSESSHTYHSPTPSPRSSITLFVPEPSSIPSTKETRQSRLVSYE